MATSKTQVKTKIGFPAPKSYDYGRFIGRPIRRVWAEKPGYPGSETWSRHKWERKRWNL
ncbi:hypothetical protein BO99DRAFT_400281 [Aspergillus violaceofuscus CBS 115571]|uniref:Uncharacterized protein n=1 Tax=Aspergillus violaceofuscus (strain CBS 115571) TaxID=1450538 RepID=A0A2V5HCU8_ASPV1|nr:hypothetical protein BO99DRAFT_400281 [Aspergillus violaceofuscus CBS 115571]